LAHRAVGRAARYASDHATTFASNIGFRKSPSSKRTMRGAHVIASARPAMSIDA
jgi:hypothetical protein